MLDVCFVYVLFCLGAEHNLCFFRTVKIASPAVLSSYRKLASQGKGEASLMARMFLVAFGVGRVELV